MYEPTSDVVGKQRLFELPEAPGPAGPVDVDETDRCPTGEACEVCGAVEDLAAATAACQVGVFCATICPACAEQGVLPSLPVMAAFDRVGAHCEHLGIDLDQMAAITGRGEAR